MSEKLRSQLSAEDQARYDQIGEHKGMAKLKTRGGVGQEGVQMIDGSVLTVKENAAVVIAKDIVDDVKRANNGKFKEVPLLEFAKRAVGRGKPGVCTEDQIMTEVCRLQNQAIYGNKVARR